MSVMRIEHLLPASSIAFVTEVLHALDYDDHWCRL